MSGFIFGFRDFSHLSRNSAYRLKSIRETDFLGPSPVGARFGGSEMRLVLTIAAFLGILYLFYAAVSLLGSVTLF